MLAKDSPYESKTLAVLEQETLFLEFVLLKTKKVLMKLTSLSASGTAGSKGILQPMEANMEVCGPAEI